MGTQTPTPCSIRRGGTLKGLYTLAQNIPRDIVTRDAVLTALIGIPDAQQIDGLRCAHLLNSKVAIISPSSHLDADADYLFLQLGTTEPVVSESQNSGNLLAAADDIVIEANLFDAQPGITNVGVHMLNTASLAVVRTPTPEREVEYAGEARIDGVPNTSAPILIDFLDVACGSCGALLPTDQAVDAIEGIHTTLIDNGMPVVLMCASDLGVSGYEPLSELEVNTALSARIESIRPVAGWLMNLGDVTHKSVPKMCIISLPLAGGALCTRTYIPHRVHEAISAFSAVSVATACLLPKAVASTMVEEVVETGEHALRIEHSTGSVDVQIKLDQMDGHLSVKRSAYCGPHACS